MNNIFTKNKINFNHGFTLIETLFAVFIMSLSLIVFMSVVANSMFSAKYAKNEITVNYLLQETVDYIRNDRDSIVFFGDDPFSEDTWNTFVTKYVNVCSGACEISVIDNINGVNPHFEICPLGECGYLYFDPNATNGVFYTYDDTPSEGKVKTNFKRTISLKQVSSNEVSFDITIDWKNGNSNRSRSLNTILTRWQ